MTTCLMLKNEISKVKKSKKSQPYLSDHGYVDQEADDAADGRYHLSPQGAHGRFRRKHVHNSRYQTLYPYKLK